MLNKYEKSNRTPIHNPIQHNPKLLDEISIQNKSMELHLTK